MTSCCIAQSAQLQRHITLPITNHVSDDVTKQQAVWRHQARDWLLGALCDSQIQARLLRHPYDVIRMT